MLRRSISQIFPSATPQQNQQHRAQAEEADRMFSSMRNSRPMNPLPRQQTPINQSTTAYTTHSPSSFDMPGSQFGALPLPVELAVRQRQPLMASAQRREVVLDAAMRHPVFFTERLKKPPNGVLAGGSISPVAEGYVFNDGGRKWGDVEVKL
ncbi:uncharacterized protein BP5553_04344 [Venustampulla echinocandica]|uniref:Uncharacterized protein n=1 Tax=Venustampulla echinocandica TaxID=2656787 RepID=A0A370TWU6_9HELO|nr:uncharacterized protein BP5553_04344 [Venustampulla echinocandica]RDL40004.1 hypothetical protein BP5553_04344 [Venustampulla echinocandica]